MIVDGKYLKSDDDENVISDYWDIEDRLYEQYKEVKMGDQNRNKAAFIPNQQTRRVGLNCSLKRRPKRTEVGEIR